MDISPEEALARLAPHERESVVRLRERLREEYGPRLRDLRLFGSKLRGDSTDESDIDVLVLIQAEQPEDVLRVIDLAVEINSLLSPVVVDFDRYHAPATRATGFYRELREHSAHL